MVMTLAFVLALLSCFLFYRKERLVKLISTTGGCKNSRAMIKLWIIWACLGSAFFQRGFCRGKQAVEWSLQEQELSLDGTGQTVSGRVLSIKASGKYQVVVLENCVIAGQPEEGKPHLRRLQVYLEEDKGSVRPLLGSRVSATGEIGIFSTARNPGEFDYALYYRSLGLNYRMFASYWQQTGQEASLWREYLYGLSEYAGQVLERVAKPEDAGIFRAAILGEKSQLDDEIRDLYQKSGIAHLLAISGLHLSLVSAAVYGTLRRLGAGYGGAGLLGSMLLIFYGMLTGASPSVIRALVMALCGFLAAYLGRTYDLCSALGLAALLLLWDNPYRLCQAGVQLSFGAVAGIAVTAEVFLQGEAKEKEEKRKNKWPLADTLVYSLGMQGMTLPFVLYHYFQIPVYGILINLLAVPLMGIVVASGAAAVLLGSIWLPAGRFAAGSGHAILMLYEWLCRFFDRFPGSTLLLGRPELWQIATYFGGLMATMCLWKKRKRKYSLLLLAGLPLLLLPLPVRGMEVDFLDVGQGDGICIRTQDITILVDGGSTDQKRLGENRLEPFLKSKGISKIDYAIVSHGDQDHISGLIYLLEQEEIVVNTLILPWMGKQEEIYEQLRRLALEQGGDVQWMKRGDCLKSGRLKMICRYPEGQGQPLADRNEHSLVLQVDYEDFHMLLTGDMSGGGERHMIELEQSEPIKGGTAGLGEIQVLKVAHHGSRYSTTEEWLECLRPHWAVISYGEKNRYGHPGQEVMAHLSERKVQIWETAEKGAISLRTDGQKIWWKTWLTKCSSGKP